MVLTFYRARHRSSEWKDGQTLNSSSPLADTHRHQVFVLWYFYDRLMASLAFSSGYLATGNKFRYATPSRNTLIVSFDSHLHLHSTNSFKFLSSRHARRCMCPYTSDSLFCLFSASDSKTDCCVWVVSVYVMYLCVHAPCHCSYVPKIVLRLLLKYVPVLFPSVFFVYARRGSLIVK